MKMLHPINPRTPKELDLALKLVPEVFAQPLEAGLTTLAAVQRLSSSLTPGCIPEGDEPPTQDQIRTYFLALFVELGELVQELSWKPWKNEKVIDKARVADEFADILAFMGIIVEYLKRLGVTPDDLAAAYVEKTKVNMNRFNGEVPGYDKASSK